MAYLSSNILFVFNYEFKYSNKLLVNTIKTKITLHFYAKSTKANANGLILIYVRLTVDGKRHVFKTKKFVEKSKLSSELAKMKGTT
jgi:hypothetical protein